MRKMVGRSYSSVATLSSTQFKTDTSFDVQVVSMAGSFWNTKLALGPSWLLARQRGVAYLPVANNADSERTNTRRKMKPGSWFGHRR